MQANQPLRIAIVVFDGISAFHLSVPLLVFGENRAELGIPACDVRICAYEQGVLHSNAGLGLVVPHGLEALDDAEIVIVPSWHAEAAAYPEALLEAVRAAYARGATVVGLCLGAYVLAEAGILSGKRATTHWAAAAHFAASYPDVDLDATVLYAQSGRVITSAGTAAGLDCCLYLMQQYFGAEVTQRVANRLVVAPHRSGGQAQFIERSLPQTGDQDRVGVLMQWLETHFTETHTLASLAARANMSTRSLSRHFMAAVGATPIEWITLRRLTYARRLLETSEQGIETIAQACGFQSGLSLRKHFQRVLHITPTAYRAQFHH